MSTNFHLVEGPQARMIDPEGVPWPDGTAVIYATDDSGIIGRTALVEFAHVEGTWTREDKRGGTLAFRLLRKLEELVADTGRTHLTAFAYDEQPEVAEYLERLGYEKQPLTVWAKTLKKEEKAA